MLLSGVKGGRGMQEIVSRYWYWLASTPDLSVRNLVTLVFCITLYSVFLSRDREKPYGRARQPSQSPDSALRNVRR